MSRSVRSRLFLALFGLCAGAVTHAQPATSLGDLARKERARKSPEGSSKVYSNEEVQQAVFDEYPVVQARFAMPKGWAKPIPARNLVIAPCPGTQLAPGSPNPESVTCALAVGIEGSSRKSRANAQQALLALQAELARKVKQQVEPWRSRELGGMPATETVADLVTAGETRRMRLAVAVHPQTGLVYLAAIVSVPERFNEFAPALDTVLATFEPTPKPPAPPRD